MNEYYRVIPDFFPLADNLRQHFVKQMSSPRQADEHRFVWDYWTVENQYSLVRTPAYHFFPEEIFDDFQNHLTRWGQENLGCLSISPAWLSYYPDGAFQNFHADIPHGPWAFVFSLTPWEGRSFEGGETLLLRPEILDFWNNFDSSVGLEADSIFKVIPSPFNQLTVFDPRIPHGVSRVHGSRDPLKARLVIHGWFTEPRPFISKNVDEDLATEELNDCLSGLVPQLAEFASELTGILSIKISTSPNQPVEIKMNSLVDRSDPLGRFEDNLSTEAIRRVVEHFSFYSFTCLTDQDDYIVIPLIF